MQRVDKTRPIHGDLQTLVDEMTRNFKGKKLNPFKQKKTEAEAIRQLSAALGDVSQSIFLSIKDFYPFLTADSKKRHPQAERYRIIFDNINNIVMQDILSQQDAKQAIKVFNRWLKVMELRRQANDLFTTQAIFAGLDNSALDIIPELKIEKSAQSTKLNAVRALKINKQGAGYDLVVKLIGAQVPAIPYLGVYQNIFTLKGEGSSKAAGDLLTKLKIKKDSLFQVLGPLIVINNSIFTKIQSINTLDDLLLFLKVLDEVKHPTPEVADGIKVLKSLAQINSKKELSFSAEFLTSLRNAGIKQTDINLLASVPTAENVIKMMRKIEKLIESKSKNKKEIKTYRILIADLKELITLNEESLALVKEESTALTKHLNELATMQENLTFREGKSKESEEIKMHTDSMSWFGKLSTEIEADFDAFTQQKFMGSEIQEMDKMVAKKTDKIRQTRDKYKSKYREVEVRYGKPNLDENHLAEVIAARNNLAEVAEMYQKTDSKYNKTDLGPSSSFSSLKKEGSIILGPRGSKIQTPRGSRILGSKASVAKETDEQKPSLLEIVKNRYEYAQRFFSILSEMKPIASLNTQEEFLKYYLLARDIIDQRSVITKDETLRYHLKGKKGQESAQTYFAKINLAAQLFDLIKMVEKAERLLTKKAQSLGFDLLKLVTAAQQSNKKKETNEVEVGSYIQSAVIPTKTSDEDLALKEELASTLLAESDRGSRVKGSRNSNIGGSNIKGSRIGSRNLYRHAVVGSQFAPKNKMDGQEIPHINSGEVREKVTPGSKIELSGQASEHLQKVVERLNAHKKDIKINLAEQRRQSISSEEEYSPRKGQVQNVTAAFENRSLSARGHSNKQNNSVRRTSDPAEVTPSPRSASQGSVSTQRLKRLSGEQQGFFSSAESLTRSRTNSISSSTSSSPRVSPRPFFEETKHVSTRASKGKEVKRSDKKRKGKERKSTSPRKG